MDKVNHVFGHANVICSVVDLADGGRRSMVMRRACCTARCPRAADQGLGLVPVLRGRIVGDVHICRFD
jgi:hypothetical protein